MVMAVTSISEVGVGRRESIMASPCCRNSCRMPVAAVSSVGCVDGCGRVSVSSSTRARRANDASSVTVFGITSDLLLVLVVLVVRVLLLVVLVLLMVVFVCWLLRRW